MDKASTGKQEVCGVTVWVDESGNSTPIPAEFADMKFTKANQPHKKDPKYGAFMDWLKVLVVPPGVAPPVDPSVQDAQDDKPVEFNPAAQDLANRIWEGQSVSLHKNERIRRIRMRLIDKGMDPDSVRIG